MSRSRSPVERFQSSIFYAYYHYVIALQEFYAEGSTERDEMRAIARACAIGEFEVPLPSEATERMQNWLNDEGLVLPPGLRDKLERVLQFAHTLSGSSTSIHSVFAFASARRQQVLDEGREAEQPLVNYCR